MRRTTTRNYESINPTINPTNEQTSKQTNERTKRLCTSSPAGSTSSFRLGRSPLTRLLSVMVNLSYDTTVTTPHYQPPPRQGLIWYPDRQGGAPRGTRAPPRGLRPSTTPIHGFAIPVVDIYLSSLEIRFSAACHDRCQPVRSVLLLRGRRLDYGSRVCVLVGTDT